MSSNCVRNPQGYDASTNVNVTDLLRQRYQNSPKDDLERLIKCWGYNDCGDCHRSEGFCGWCAISSTCLPLPTDTFSRTFPLLSPLRHSDICAMGVERFELRTAFFGCQVSTITFLTSIVTIFSTLFGVLVLFGLFRCIGFVSFGLCAKNGGYVLYPHDGDEARDDIWMRKSHSWGAWWRRLNGIEKESEVESIEEPPATARWLWWEIKVRQNMEVQDSERRPLLTRIEDAE